MSSSKEAKEALEIKTIFITILFAGLMLISAFSLTSCGDYNHIYIEAVIKNKETIKHVHTQLICVGKGVIPVRSTSYTYYFDFNDKKEYREAVSCDDYNKYEVGDIYIIAWKDTEENRVKATEYFSSDKITYEADQKKS